MKKAGKVDISIDIKKRRFRFKFHLSSAFVFVLFASSALLAVSFSCPDMLADFVRWIISTAIIS